MLLNRSVCVPRLLGLRIAIARLACPCLARKEEKEEEEEMEEEKEEEDDK